MDQPVIISAVRTPVGRYMGALKDVAAYDLARLVPGATELSCSQFGEAVIGYM